MMVTQEVTPEGSRCPRCGMTNVPGAVFCATCGNRLTPSAQPSAAPPPVTAGQALAPASQAVGSAVEWIKRGGGRTSDEIARERRFPGLQATAGLLKVAAVVTGVWGVLGEVAWVNDLRLGWNFNPLDVTGRDTIFAIGAPIVFGLLLWAAASVILVLLDIEVSVRQNR